MNVVTPAVDDNSETGRLKAESHTERYGVLTSPLTHKIVVCLFIGLPWAMPTIFFGIGQFYSNLYMILLLLPFAAFRIYTILLGRRLDKFELIILGFMLLTFITSFISGNYLFPQPVLYWISGILFLVPLLFVTTDWWFRFEIKTLADGLLIVTTAVAVLVFVDQIFPIAALDFFGHTSSQSVGVRRIVIMHNEMAFSFVIALTRLVNSLGVKEFGKYLVVILLLGYSLFVVAETRLPIAAAMIASLLYMVFIFSSKRKALILIICVVGVSLLAPFVFQKYIGNLYNLTDLQSVDNSTKIRYFFIEYFNSFFQKTYGIGFGFMWPSPKSDNIISFALYRAAELYGYQDYWISLVDTRIYSALFQYGYAGLGYILFMTLYSAFVLLRIARHVNFPHRDEVAAVGLVVIALMLSPLPINLFTADNTYAIGGFVWCFTKVSLDSFNRWNRSKA